MKRNGAVYTQFWWDIESYIVTSKKIERSNPTWIVINCCSIFYFWVPLSLSLCIHCMRIGIHTQSKYIQLLQQIIACSLTSWPFSSICSIYSPGALSQWHINHDWIDTDHCPWPDLAPAHQLLRLGNFPQVVCEEFLPARRGTLPYGARRTWCLASCPEAIFSFFVFWTFLDCTCRRIQLFYEQKCGKS